MSNLQALQPVKQHFGLQFIQAKGWLARAQFIHSHSRTFTNFPASLVVKDQSAYDTHVPPVSICWSSGATTGRQWDNDPSTAGKAEGKAPRKGQMGFNSILSGVGCSLTLIPLRWQKGTRKVLEQTVVRDECVWTNELFFGMPWAPFAG